MFLFSSCSFQQNAVIRTPTTPVKFRPKQRRKPSIKSTVITRRYNIVRRPHHQGSESVTTTLSSHIRFISWPPSWANSPSTNSSSTNSPSAQSSWKAALTPRDNLAQPFSSSDIIIIICTSVCFLYARNSQLRKMGNVQLNLIQLAILRYCIRCESRLLAKYLLFHISLEAYTIWCTDFVKMSECQKDDSDFASLCKQRCSYHASDNEMFIYIFMLQRLFTCFKEILIWTWKPALNLLAHVAYKQIYVILCHIVSYVNIVVVSCDIMLKHVFTFTSLPE